MRILSVAETAQVLETDDLPRLVATLNRKPNDSVTTYTIPKDSGVKVSLANRIANMLLDRGKVIMWIREWGVWPNPEHADLFYGYRRSLNEGRALSEAPAHVLSPDEGPTLVSLLCLCLFFAWGFEVLSLDRKVLVTASHDEWLDVCIAEDEEGFSSFFNEHIGAVAARC